jgi:hypothetical protein
MDYKSWSLELKTLLEQKQVVGIVDSTDKAPDVKNVKNTTEFEAQMKQHGIAWSTILLAMERTLQQQIGVQKNTKPLWDQLKVGYTSKVKLNVWALEDQMAAVRLGDCDNE